ncbi:type I polyketide synthase [Spongiactinospora sp. 9N601]|uniref:type I polyketide synthase n=1 Tax=Spongiactinospora sp. 9N601 TaxID=3375149 RepID=UPI0037B0B9A6
MTRTPVAEHPDAVAIIGMAARLPGARDTEEYWDNLCEGVESIARHTREEMIANGAAPDLVDDPLYVNASGALSDVDRFDAAFFGYSAREAAIMDPQHRIFLECAYHALEDAGVDGFRHPGEIGVYAGCMMNTYLLYNVMPNSREVLAAGGDQLTMVGNDKDFLATRVSYQLDLRGPSMTVQTACSSSLVATHMAVRALLDGECSIALAGGVSVRLPHAAGYLAPPGGTSSSDGHGRAFDADATGAVVGSGTGVVVLKRAADALRDGDQIYGFIRGTAINNDGRHKASFTAPSSTGQARAIRQALRRAGVSARDISFVEAHGTGTVLGDPLEVAALTSAFREWTSDTGYCRLTSVKPNIGHLDPAAAVAGLIKAVLALRNGVLPPQINYSRPNPKLRLESTPFTISVQPVPLDTAEPALGCVNSLGMGGTNAHVVLEAPPERPRSEPSPRRRHPILLSARSAEALQEMSLRLAQWIKENRGEEPADVAWTLATGRPEHPFRRVVVSHDLRDAASAVSARGGRRQRDAHVPRSGRVALLFPGQGAQTLAMGARLATGDPVFREHLNTVTGLFAQDSGLDLGEVLQPGPGRETVAQEILARTEITQAALFAVEWALGRTLVQYGVRPYAMLGHSVGELVAATLAGVLTLPDAVAAITLRGRLMSESGPGAMVSVTLPADEAAKRASAADLAVAAVNGTELVTLSGAIKAVEELERELRAEGVACKRLETAHAFHSPMQEQAAARFGEAMSGTALCPPDSLVVSNVTGAYLTHEQAADPGYWAGHMLRPVQFAVGLELLIRDGVTIFLEAGPGNALSRLAKAAAPDTTCLSVLAEESGEERPDLVDVLTGHWLAGGEVDWNAWYAGERRGRLSLPLYPFARTRHWLEPAPHETATAAAPRPVPTPVSAPAARPAAPAAQAAADPSWTPMERYLGHVWRALLGVDEIGLHDNFFELGGHSLLAMQLATHLRKDGIESLTMEAMLETPSIALLAQYLESLGATPPDGAHPAPPPPRAASPASPAAPAWPATAWPPAAPVGPLPRQAHADAPGDGDVTGDDDMAALVAEVESMSDEEVLSRLAELEGGAES